MCSSPGSTRGHLEGQVVVGHNAIGRFGMPPREGGGLCNDFLGEMPLVFMLSKGIIGHLTACQALLLVSRCLSTPPQCKVRQLASGWVFLWPR